VRYRRQKVHVRYLISWWVFVNVINGFLSRHWTFETTIIDRSIDWLIGWLIWRPDCGCYQAYRLIAMWRAMIVVRSNTSTWRQQSTFDAELSTTASTSSSLASSSRRWLFLPLRYLPTPARKSR